MDFFQPLAAVGFVMALLAGALMMLRRRGTASFRPRRLETIERLSLGPHHSLHLIRFDDRSILMATAPTSFQIVCESAACESMLCETRLAK
jgi:flagellar biogenesis protein FliO